MPPDPEKRLLARLRQNHPYRFDFVAQFVYLSVVYVWALSLYPLGRDYRSLHDRGDGLPFPVGPLWRWEVSVFDDRAWAYIGLNLVLLYGCMMAVYGLVRLVVREGPIWFAALASTLFMANPVHSEAVLNVGGMSDLFPGLFALAAVLAYGYWRKRGGYGFLPVSLACFALATLPFFQNLGLWVVLLLYEALGAPKEQRRSYRHLLPFLAVAVAAAYLHRDGLGSPALDLGGMFAPLYLIFYPIGLLPETVQTFRETPAWAWAGTGAVLFVVLLVSRKVGRRAFLFGIGGAAALRLFQGGGHIDPVHLIGGGQLVAASGLFAVSLVVLFRRMFEHPKWRANTVMLTTFLCLVLFALQIRVIGTWRDAGNQVRDFQERALQLGVPLEGRPIAVLPDYLYTRGAPIDLSSSIAYDTPFSTAVPHRSLLRLNTWGRGQGEVELRSYTPERAEVRVYQDSTAGLIPSREALANRSFQVSVEERGENFLQFVIVPLEGALPERVLTLAPKGHEERQP